MVAMNLLFRKLHLVSLILGIFLLTAGTIDLDNLFNYSTQPAPVYMSEMSPAPSVNQFDNKIATLGRVLFYDKKVSSNDQISCASCHAQANAFGLLQLQGPGVNGLSLRRPMRLLNLSFSEPTGLFWDERTATLESQAVQPIKDHIEMGYSGANGDPDFSQLINKLSGLGYYDTLFTFAFGNNAITEQRIAHALAQFVRSIVSFDSRFDVGVANGFTNFSPDELAGKTLFNSNPLLDGLGARIGGGLGCFHCHSMNSFHFVTGRRNNGVITEIDGGQVLNINRSPSLRDLFDPNGNLNGPLFHNGQAATIGEVLDHYNNIVVNLSANPRLDARFSSFMGFPLNITPAEKRQVEAFLKTLSGNDIYTNPKWSDPFDSNGTISIVRGGLGALSFLGDVRINLFPNPVTDLLNLKSDYEGMVEYRIFDTAGRQVGDGGFEGEMRLPVANLSDGLFAIHFFSGKGQRLGVSKFVKR